MKRPWPAAMRSEYLSKRGGASARWLLHSWLGLLLAALAGAAAAQGCQVTFDQPMIEFGTVNKTQLQPFGNRHLLGERQLQLTVQCSADTDMVLHYLADSITGERYRFGERGTYSLQLSDARLDGRSVALGTARSGQAWQRQGNRVRWLPGMQVAPLRAGAPLDGTTLTARLTVRGWVDHAQAMAGVAELQASGVVQVEGATAALALQASVVPAACRLQLGEGGRVDFGVIPAGQLSASKATSLWRSLSAAVSCDGPTRFALRAVDNRQPAQGQHVQGAARSVLFGAGKSAGDGLAWSLRLDGPVMGDGQALQPLYATQGSGGWAASPAPAYFHTDNRLLGFASSQHRAAGPALIRQLHAMLRVELYVAPLRQLQLRDQIPIDGAATLELVYL